MSTALPVFEIVQCRH